MAFECVGLCFKAMSYEASASSRRLREAFFKKDAVAFFVPFNKSPIPQYFYFETRTQYKLNRTQYFGRWQKIK